jgi:hypothetical protein
MKRTKHRSKIFRPTALMVGLACALAGGEARADAAAAERLFREAKSLMSQKRYTEACPKLAESQKADPSGGTILHLALCHKEEGRIATAYKELQEAVLFARRDQREDREKAATALIAELEPKLSKLTIAVMPEVMRLPGIEIKRDGTPVPASEWGSALTVDPGPHTVTAWAPGRKPLQKSVDLRGDAATASVVISALEVDPPGQALGARSDGAATQAGTASGGGFGTQKKLALVAGGVGLAAIGVGSVFGVQAASAKSDSDAHCDGNVCDDEGFRLREDGIVSGNVATALFIGGGAAVAGGVVLFLTAPSAKRAKTEAYAPSIVVSPFGASVTGRW